LRLYWVYYLAHSQTNKGIDNGGRADDIKEREQSRDSGPGRSERGAMWKQTNKKNDETNIAKE